MSTNNLQVLLVEFTDRLDYIHRCQEFIKMALLELEQSQQSPVATLRAELLVSAYLEETQEHFRYLKQLEARRQQLSN